MILRFKRNVLLKENKESYAVVLHLIFRKLTFKYPYGTQSINEFKLIQTFQT